MALIVRPVGFNFRDKLPNPRWCGFWDWGLAVGGFVASLVFGIAFGNLLLGVPFGFEPDLRLDYTGTLFDLLNPFGLAAGLLNVLMLAMHGGSWLALKADGPVAVRAARTARLLGRLTAAVFGLAGWWVATGIDGYIDGDVACRAVEPARQDGDPRGRSLVRQLPYSLGADRGPGGGYRRRPLGGADPGSRRAGIGFHRQRGFGRRHRRDRRRVAVSVFTAVVDRSRDEPDGVGCVEQPADLVHHADRDGDFSAHRAAYTAYALRVVHGKVRLAEVIGRDSHY